MSLLYVFALCLCFMSLLYVFAFVFAFVNFLRTHSLVLSILFAASDKPRLTLMNVIQTREVEVRRSSITRCSINFRDLWFVRMPWREKIPGKTTIWFFGRRDNARRSFEIVATATSPWPAGTPFCLRTFDLLRLGNLSYSQYQFQVLTGRFLS